MTIDWVTACVPAGATVQFTANTLFGPLEFVAGNWTDAAVANAAPVPDQFGVFSYGPGQDAISSGNGTLCIADHFERLSIELASGNVLMHLVDFTNPPSATGLILPGSTWNFQGWFRDPMAGGSFFNLTNALTLQFR